jgi:hypothetical protein
MASVNATANTGGSKSMSVADLQHRVPNATEEECQRFYEAFSDDSMERLTAYMEWRKEHQLNAPRGEGKAPSTDTTKSLFVADGDARNWQIAYQGAIAHARKHSADTQEEGHPGDAKDDAPNTEQKEHPKNHRRFRRKDSNSKRDSSSSRQKDKPTVFHARDNDLNRPIYSHANTADGNPLCDRKGHQIFQILAARVDLQAACANTYATAFLLYLDAHLRRDTLDLVTLLIDVRPGRGWPNLPALQMLGFIRCLAQVLHDSHPCRLHQCILFPVPRPAVMIWKTVQNFLDPLVRKSIVLVPGAANLTSPVPRDRLKDYFDDQAGLDLMEQTRLEAFCKKE